MSALSGHFTDIAEPTRLTRNRHRSTSLVTGTVRPGPNEMSIVLGGRGVLDLIVDVGEHSQKSTGLTARLALVAFSLVAGLSYRVVVGACIG